MAFPGAGASQKAGDRRPYGRPTSNFEAREALPTTAAKRVRKAPSPGPPGRARTIHLVQERSAKSNPDLSDLKRSLFSDQIGSFQVQGEDFAGLHFV